MFEWTSQCEDAFRRLKIMFTEGPILAHFDFMRSTRVETDASNFALGAILSQLCEDNRWHPIAFHSRKFQPTEVNYDVHDKEMTAIVVFASGHAGPQKIRGPAKNPCPAPHRRAGQRIFFFSPHPVPLPGPRTPGAPFSRFPGPHFRFPPQIPRSGAPFFVGHRPGPRKL